jgi:hypothetical protein
MATIDELIRELERHKIKYVPNKQAYLDFMFEFVYQMTYFSDDVPVCESNQFIPRIKDFLEEDLHYVKAHYYRTNGQFYVLNVPPVKQALSCAKSYISHGLCLRKESGEFDH